MRLNIIILGILRDRTVGEYLRDTLPGKLKHIILKVRRS